MGLLDGKLAFITGGGGGISEADAMVFTAEGADLILADVRLDKAQEVADKVKGSGRKVQVVKLDVSNSAEVNACFEKVRNDCGRCVDILVNNAAKLDTMGQLAGFSDEMWEIDQKINLWGSFYTTRAVLPEMVKNQWGRIINISSVAGTLGGFGQVSYSATKAGVIGLTKTTALEGARAGVTCNCIAIGVVTTPPFFKIPDKMRERITRRIAMQKPGEPIDVAHLTAFLCSEKARYITGACIPLMGGMDLFVF